MLGILCMSGSGTRAGCSCRTVGNLQLAYETVRYNLQERTAKKAESKEKLSIPHYQPWYHVLIHRPLMMDPIPNFVVPGMVPYCVCLQLVVALNVSCCERWKSLRKHSSIKVVLRQTFMLCWVLYHRWILVEIYRLRFETLVVQDVESLVLIVHIGPFTILISCKSQIWSFVD